MFSVSKNNRIDIYQENDSWYSEKSKEDLRKFNIFYNPHSPVPVMRRGRVLVLGGEDDGHIWFDEHSKELLVDELPEMLKNIASVLGNKERRMAWKSYAKENNSVTHG